MCPLKCHERIKRNFIFVTGGVLQFYTARNASAAGCILGLKPCDFLSLQADAAHEAFLPVNKSKNIRPERGG